MSAYFSFSFSLSITVDSLRYARSCQQTINITQRMQENVQMQISAYFSFLYDLILDSPQGYQTHT